MEQSIFNQMCGAVSRHSEQAKHWKPIRWSFQYQECNIKISSFESITSPYFIRFIERSAKLFKFLMSTDQDTKGSKLLKEFTVDLWLSFSVPEKRFFKQKNQIKKFFNCPLHILHTYFPILYIKNLCYKRKMPQFISLK